MTHHEAEYEVREQRDDKILIDIWVEGRKRPIQHGVPLVKARSHADGVQAHIEEVVERIAAKHHQDPVSDEELPDSGKVQYEPDKPREPPSVREERKARQAKSEDSGNG